MKLENEMSAEEKALFSKKERNETKIEVPVEQIRLDENLILNMRNVGASDSGKICGPKAANLGQLKRMFPDKVVEGLVIPFGIFKSHMNQPMPGQNVSYWKFLTNMFLEADKQRSTNISEAEVETIIAKIIAETGATGIAAMGKVMGLAAAQLGGTAEGKTGGGEMFWEGVKSAGPTAVLQGLGPALGASREMLTGGIINAQNIENPDLVS